MMSYFFIMNTSLLHWHKNGINKKNRQQKSVVAIGQIAILNININIYILGHLADAFVQSD